MEQKINIAELLKDCPSGMELDSTIMENVYFDEVLNNSIRCYYIKNRTKIRSTVYFNKFSEYFGIENGKCVIFPKGKTTWEGFVPLIQFKDGDVVSTKNGTWIGITTGGKCGGFIPTYCVINSDDELNIYFNKKEKWAFGRLATEEEKTKTL